jgi:hypothetical protein
VCMFVIRHILPVSSNVSCFCDVSVYGLLKQLHFLGMKRLCCDFLGVLVWYVGVSVLDGWVCM